MSAVIVVAASGLLALLIVTRTICRVANTRAQTRVTLARESNAADSARRRHELQHAAAREDAAATATAAAARTRSWVGHRVTVHTKQPDDHTLHGLLTSDDTDWLVLDDAEYVTSNGPSSLPGRRARIPREDIAWIDDLGSNIAAVADAEAA